MSIIVAVAILALLGGYCLYKISDLPESELEKELRLHRAKSAVSADDGLDQLQAASDALQPNIEAHRIATQEAEKVKHEEYLARELARKTEEAKSN